MLTSPAVPVLVGPSGDPCCVMRSVCRVPVVVLTLVCFVCTLWLGVSVFDAAGIAPLCVAGVDIMEFGGHIVAYTQCDDLLMFVTGLASENELILAEVLGSLDESLNILLRGLVYEENVLLHLQGVLLVIDELVDQEGVVMESDPAELVSRAGVQSNSYIDNVPMGEQTLSQALQIAKDQIARSILQG